MIKEIAIKYKAIATTIVVVLLALYVGTISGNAEEDDFIFGVLVSNPGRFAESIKSFPGVTHAYSYSGFMKLDSDVEMIPLYKRATFRQVKLPYCPTTMLVFAEPNVRTMWMTGSPIVEQDPVTLKWTINSPRKAVEMLREVEETCPDTVLVVGQVSPHNWCNQYGGYCGTGADWLDEFLTAYGEQFPHILGAFVSENTHADEYPISQQVADYVAVKEKHNVEKIWATYFNIKYGSYAEWKDSLALVLEEMDAIFVASPRANPFFYSWGYSTCFRALMCKGDFTDAGIAYLELLEE